AFCSRAPGTWRRTRRGCRRSKKRAKGIAGGEAMTRRRRRRRWPDASTSSRKKRVAFCHRWHNTIRLLGNRSTAWPDWGVMAMKALLVSFLLLGAASASAETAVEAIAAHKHMGVATCSNSVCHGASQPFRDSDVMQNEFAIWQEFDPHAKT